MTRFILLATVLWSLASTSQAAIVLGNGETLKRQGSEKTFLLDATSNAEILNAMAAAVPAPGGVAYESSLMGPLTVALGDTFSIPYLISVDDAATIALGDFNFVFDASQFDLVSVDTSNGYSGITSGNELLLFDSTFTGRSGETDVLAMTANFQAKPSATTGSSFVIQIRTDVDPSDGIFDLQGSLVPSNSVASQGVNISAVPEPSAFLFWALVTSTICLGHWLRLKRRLKVVTAFLGKKSFVTSI